MPRPLKVRKIVRKIVKNKKILSKPKANLKSISPTESKNIILLKKSNQNQPKIKDVNLCGCDQEEKGKSIDKNHFVGSSRY